MMTQGKGRVLLVDDEASIQRSLRAYLEDEGFEVLAAESGEKALAFLNAERVDASIVDIRLPGMDGNAFMERACELYPEMVFLICTGSVGYRVPSTLRARGIGDGGVFQKPLIDLSVLAGALRQRLDKRGG